MLFSAAACNRQLNDIQLKRLFLNTDGWLFWVLICEDQPMVSCPDNFFMEIRVF